MNECADTGAILSRIRQQAAADQLRLTQHAHQEMTEEDFTLADVVEGITSATILENYPVHRRGPCCLLNGVTKEGRPVHIVCTAVQPVLIVITVYEPKPPRWLTPTQRRQK